LTDEVWLTLLRPAVAAQRLMERSGLNREEAEARIREVARRQRLSVSYVRRISQRLMARSGLTREEAEARIASQLSNDERLEHADVVIDTDCSLAEVARRVDELWESLMARLAARAG
jgi:dephospho-CoA kinase